MPRDPPTKPRRRTYITGQSLPALTSDFRPIPLGTDELGEPDGQIRAFAVNIINRSDRSIFIKEGPEGADVDAAEIPRFQSYTLYENNGINRVNLKGESGGEKVEIRTLEAHNDFGIRDKIEAFIRSVSHFFATNKQETVITGAETVISTNITDSETTFDTAIGSVANDVVFATNIQGQDTNLSTDIENVASTATFNSNITGTNINLPIDIENVAGNATFNSNITGSDVTLPISGNVDIDAITDTITIDDITAANASFDGDITGQSNFDVAVQDRRGTTVKRVFSNFNQGTDQLGTVFLYDPADATYILESVMVETSGEDAGQFGVRVLRDNPPGSGTGFYTITPYYTWTAARAAEYAGENDPWVTVGAKQTNTRWSYTIHFPQGIKIEEGETLAVKGYEGGPKGTNTNLDFARFEAQLTRLDRNEPT